MKFSMYEKETKDKKYHNLQCRENLTHLRKVSRTMFLNWPACKRRNRMIDLSSHLWNSSRFC